MQRRTTRPAAVLFHWAVAIVLAVTSLVAACDRAGAPSSAGTGASGPAIGASGAAR